MILLTEQISATIRYEETYLEHSFNMSRQRKEMIIASHYEVELTISYRELGRIHLTQVPSNIKNEVDILDVAFRDLIKHDLRSNKAIYTNWYTRKNANTINIPTFL